MQGIIDLTHDVVRIVQNIESEQPAHHDHDDDDPEHNVYKLIEQPEERKHRAYLVGANWCAGFSRGVRVVQAEAFAEFRQRQRYIGVVWPNCNTFA